MEMRYEDEKEIGLVKLDVLTFAQRNSASSQKCGSGVGRFDWGLTEQGLPCRGEN